MIRLVDAHGLRANLGAFGELLHACVHGGANIGFVLPFSRSDSEAFWRYSVAPEVEEGTRHLLAIRYGERIAGTVQFCHALMPGQTHRADVRKLPVHPAFRRRGLAREKHVTLLTLDTLTGSAAEPLCTLLGFDTAGVIPNYCRDSFVERVDPATLMYRILAP